MVTTQFLELLRAGLWEKKADESLFEERGTDWEAICRLARMQTVTGLVYDGMLTLPQELRPGKALYMRWTGEVAVIEQTNEYLDKVAVEVFSILTKEGIAPVLLKGQGVATVYPNPKHRQCGDIDLYVGKRDYKRANEIMVSAGAQPDHKDSNKHTSFSYKRAMIEIHCEAARLRWPLADRRFRKFTQNTPPHCNNALLSGGAITIPDSTFNAVFLFVHMFNHFFSSGVGVRQVCDWARVLTMLHHEIDNEQVLKTAKALGIYNSLRAFSYVAVEYIGLDKKYIPVELNTADKEWGEELMREIYRMGNFGKYNKEYALRPTGYWSGKWFSFTYFTRRCNQLRRFAPMEALWQPMTMIERFIQVRIIKEFFGWR